MDLGSEFLESVENHENQNSDKLSELRHFCSEIRSAENESENKKHMMQKNWNQKEIVKENHSTEVEHTKMYPSFTRISSEIQTIEESELILKSKFVNIFWKFWLENLFEKSVMKMETWELKLAKS